VRAVCVRVGWTFEPAIGEILPLKASQFQTLLSPQKNDSEFADLPAAFELLIFWTMMSPAQRVVPSNHRVPRCRI
jgi:hypothetical protein